MKNQIFGEWMHIHIMVTTNEDVIKVQNEGFNENQKSVAYKSEAKLGQGKKVPKEKSVWG